MAEMAPVTVKIQADTSDFLRGLREAEDALQEFSLRVDAKLAEHDRKLDALVGLLKGNHG